jgi:glycerophosphoryl diester phosphodiesterase
MVEGMMRGEGWRPWQRGQPISVPGLNPVIGHRGAAARAPENTLAGLRVAAELGAHWVEFDVMLSKDGVPVLMHDETLERTTNGRGRVARHTAAELVELDAGAWFGPQFAGERVPTFEQTVTELLRLQHGANVEIKPSGGRGAETGEVVAGYLREAWPSDGPPLLLSSFDRGALAAAQRVAPAIPRGLLAEWLPGDWDDAMRALACSTLHLNHRRITLGRLRSLAAKDVAVLLYTVNDGSRARDLLARGAMAVITDVPDVVIEFLESPQ